MQGKFRISKLVFGLSFLICVLPFLSPQCLHAQNFPTKPITLIIPFGPGGYSDLLGRMLGPFVEKELGQPIILRYRPGAAGTIGANAVAQAKPDGYTLLSAHPNCNTINPVVTGRGKGPGEMATICLINQAKGFFWAIPDAPFNNFKEMVAWAKANPGQLIHGNPGTWSAGDLTWKWLEVNVGFTSRNTPFSGGGKLLTALLGGHIQVTRLGNATAFPHYRAGKIKPLWMSGSKRHPDLPDIPCLLEEGYDMKGLGSSWVGIMAPNGTPRQRIDIVAAAFKKATENEKAIEALKKMGERFGFLGPDEFEKTWQEEFNAYKELVKIVKK